MTIRILVSSGQHLSKKAKNNKKKMKKMVSVTCTLQKELSCGCALVLQSTQLNNNFKSSSMHGTSRHAYQLGSVFAIDQCV